ncbi:polysaccharide deacetylase family protein [Asticcacaulis sp.]|uniref:polysaccharide deacetylase family protein n=1 Tax=Asticcacaulis sp. TaxID=1872648 RepID=UPI0031DE58A9
MGAVYDPLLGGLRSGATTASDLAKAGVIPDFPGKSIFNFAPTGKASVDAPIVDVSFCENSAGWLSFGAGANYTTEAFPVAAPNGQAAGAKLVTAASISASAYVRSYSFEANPGGGAPKTNGMKSFVKAPGQIMWVLVWLESDAYQLNTAYSDTVAVRFSRDGSNFVEWYFTTGAYSLKSGWNMLCMRWDETDAIRGPVANVTGTVADGQTINLVQIGCVAGSAAGMTIRVAAAGHYNSVPSKPTIAIVPDGWYAEHQTRMLPLLTARGIKATFTTGAAYWWNDPSLPNALLAAGMEIGQQVYTHIDYPQSGDVKYNADLDLAITYMKALGYSYQVQSMPYNDITRAQVNIAAAKGVKLIREGRQAVTPITPWGLGAGSMNIGQFGLDNVTLTDAKKAIDAVVRYGGLLTVTLHQLIAGGNGVSTTGNSVQTYENDFAAWLDYGLAQGVSFVTMGDVVRAVATIKAQNP